MALPISLLTVVALFASQGALSAADGHAMNDSNMTASVNDSHITTVMPSTAAPTVEVVANPTPATTANATMNTTLVTTVVAVATTVEVTTVMPSVNTTLATTVMPSAPLVDICASGGTFMTDMVLDGIELVDGRRLMDHMDGNMTCGMLRGMMMPFEASAATCQEDITLIGENASDAQSRMNVMGMLTPCCGSEGTVCDQFLPTPAPTPAPPTPAPTDPTPAPPTPAPPTPAPTDPTPAPTAAPEPTVVTGSMGMTVDDPQAFVDDPTAKEAVSDGLAAALEVPKSYVSVELSVTPASRRLAMPAAGRRLSGSVTVDYTVTIPPNPESDSGVSITVESISETLIEASEDDSAFQALSNSIAQKVQEATGITVVVEEIATPVVTVPTPVSAKATCGDADGAGAATAAAVCPEGYVSKEGVASTDCAAAACDTSTASSTDTATCCVATPAPTPAPATPAPATPAPATTEEPTVDASPKKAVPGILLAVAVLLVNYGK